MGLTILSVAYPLTRVGPDAVGGSEQVLTVLDRTLTAAGHRSLVIAAEDSQIEGTLIPAQKAGRRVDDPMRERARERHRKLIERTLAKYPVDLVHMQSLDFHCYLPAVRVPVLSTLHLPADWYPRKIFRIKRSEFRLNCVSYSQMRQCPPSPLMLPPITNGVDIERLRPDEPAGKKDFALAMGRICPEKGYHHALDAARKAGVRMLLAGEVFPFEEHRRYFRDEIQPRLNRDREFIGPLKFARKRKLLAQARCLVVSSTVAETSSLVAMEALACGTPVVAFRVGALPEVVEDGRTGFLVSNVSEMAQAIRGAGELSSQACRLAAVNRFSEQRMASRYLQVYSYLVESSKARDEAPRLARATSCVA